MQINVNHRQWAYMVVTFLAVGFGFFGVFSLVSHGIDTVQRIQDQMAKLQVLEERRSSVKHSEEGENKQTVELTDKHPTDNFIFIDEEDHSQVEAHARHKRRADIITERPQERSPFGGAGYVRWGRTSCSDVDTELIYHGVAGGSWYEHVGGAGNILCLPLNPIWGRYTDALESHAFIYGAEYETGDNLYLHDNAEKLINHNVPCAVCRSRSRASVVMVPARNVCYEGWTLEYQGYLMAGHHAHQTPTEYTCVDEAPEADPAGFRDENGKLFYQVEAQCGSLPCPSYVNGRELTCAVCTK